MRCSGTPCARRLSPIGGPTNVRSSVGDGTGRPHRRYATAIDAVMPGMGSMSVPSRSRRTRGVVTPPILSRRVVGCAVVSWVEVLGFVSGAVCVWLATRQNVWNFPVGIANNVLFLWLFTDAGLYANAGLQVVFAGLAVLGWVWWVRGGPDRHALTVSRTPWWAWPAGAVVVAACTAGLTVLLPSSDGSSAPFWDALTTSSSLVAQ